MGVHERLPIFGRVNAVKGIEENGMVYIEPFLMKGVGCTIFPGIAHRKQSNRNEMLRDIK